MRLRRPLLVLAAAATAAAGLVAHPAPSGADPAALSSAEPATATRTAAASPWTRLSTGPGVAISYSARVARWGKRLLVVWPQQSGPSTTAIRSRVLAADGRPAGPVGTVVDWASVSSDPAVLLLAGVPTVVFGGLRSTDTTDPYTGPMAYAQAADARSWALGAGSLTQTGLAYGDYGLGAVDDGTGSPVVALAAGSTDHVTVHHGIDSAVPAAVPDLQVAATEEAQAVNLVKDPKSGKAYALWYASRTDRSEGIHAAQVFPTVQPPVGPAPRSTVAFGGARESVNPGQNVAGAGRLGGGVWAAYTSGYPSPRTIVLWNVQTGRTLALRTAGAAQYVSLSPAPGGRLWLSWVEGGAVKAVRTNPAVTRFGALRTVPAPAGSSPTRIDGDGTLGPLDLVMNQAPGTADSAIWSTRILEALQVKATPSVARARAGLRIVVRVIDAGVPVPGARVRMGALVRVTDASGRAVFGPGSAARPGTRTITATAPAFEPGTTKVRLRG